MLFGLSAIAFRPCNDERVSRANRQLQGRGPRIRNGFVSNCYLYFFQGFFDELVRVALGAFPVVSMHRFTKRVAHVAPDLIRPGWVLGDCSKNKRGRQFIAEFRSNSLSS